MIPGLHTLSTGIVPLIRNRTLLIARRSRSQRRGLCNNTVAREIVPPPLQPSSPDHGKVTYTGKVFMGLTLLCAVWITKRYLDGKFEPIPGVHTPLEFDKEGDLVIPKLDPNAIPESVVIPGGFKQQKYEQESDGTASSEAKE